MRKARGDNRPSVAGVLRGIAPGLLVRAAPVPPGGVIFALDIELLGDSMSSSCVSPSVQHSACYLLCWMNESVKE